jgi:hypothetical protein
MHWQRQREIAQAVETLCDLLEASGMRLPYSLAIASAKDWKPNDETGRRRMFCESAREPGHGRRTLGMLIGPSTATFHVRETREEDTPPQ